MNNRELKIKTISTEFAKWQVEIENLNSLNLYDANLFSENSICDILNSIFDYELKNINSISKNHPAIDLVDYKNKIAVQVTSTKSSLKIQSTIDKFFGNNFEEKFDELLIVILGKKQKNYSNIKVVKEYNFDETKHILDFKDLLRIINILPTNRIENIAKLLEQENITKNKKKPTTNATKIKKNLALKKKLKKDFILKLDQKEWQRAIYEPWRRFTYHNAIIRSIDDKNWPNIDDSEENRISSWFKGEFWDFYDNGIELITHGGEAIFDQNGNWDILDFRGDERENNQKYKKISFHTFLRIPYEYIVDYDMEPDAYNGIPTIYVEYAKNGMPYEVILHGISGYYVANDESKSRLVNYFDNNKRIDLK